MLAKLEGKCPEPRNRVRSKRHQTRLLTPAVRVGKRFAKVRDNHPPTSLQPEMASKVQAYSITSRLIGFRIGTPSSLTTAKAP